MKIKKY